MLNQPLNTLPDYIQACVRNTLKCYDETSVLFYNGKYHERTGTMLLATYPADYKVIGYYTAKEVYTLEERENNYIEQFGDFMTSKARNKANVDGLHIERQPNYLYKLVPNEVAK